MAVDPESKRLVALARKIAESEATVLITGESGTGKEVYSRFIRDHSVRAAAPYIAINCAAIPENMLEATLFGLVASTDDMREGTSAFLQKRKATFKGS